MSLSHIRFGARTGVFLVWLPIALRLRTLPRFLERTARVNQRRERPGSVALYRAFSIVLRVSELRIFELPLFPKACMRRSLALYYALRRLGHEVEIHFGVRKDRTGLRAHSWVTLAGEPLGEQPQDAFQTIFSYPGSESKFLPVN